MVQVTLVEVMACCGTGHKILLESLLTQFADTQMRHQALRLDDAFVYRRTWVIQYLNFYFDKYQNLSYNMKYIHRLDIKNNLIYFNFTVLFGTFVEN